MTGQVLIVVFGVLLFLNVPIAISLGAASIAALYFGDLPLEMISSNVYAATSKFVLLAIPFFILGGNIMEKTGISENLIAFCQSLVGHLKGGMAIVCVVVACFFAAICGSGPATVAALGLIIIPAMVKAGYRVGFSAALIATAGAIGLIIPPSISFVVYGSITGNSIGNLFISGILPGLLMGFFLILASFWLMRKEKMEVLPRASWAERWIAFRKAFWGLLMPVIILGGIYGGIFTPTEAAAVSAVYGFAVGIGYRTLSPKVFYEILVNSTSQTAVVMLIVATASLFSWVLTVEGIAADLSASLLSFTGNNTFMFLLILNIILLFAGCILDGNSAFFILTPIIYPVAMKLGVNPIHLGTVMVMNLAIGLVTPPVGINLYVSCGLAKLSLKEISMDVWPFVLASICALMLVTYIPAIALCLVP